MRSAGDTLSRTFAALADPTRRAILSRLAEGPASVGDLARPFSISRPAISQHLRVLREAELIEQSVDARWRPCALRPEGLAEAEEWVRRHRQAWNDRFDRLEAQLDDIAASSPPDKE